MNRVLILAVLISGLLFSSCTQKENTAKEEDTPAAPAENTGQKYVMIIHGGAGTILKKNMTPEKEKAYTDKLTEALQAGYDAIQAGKNSLDAVQAAINVMEDSPLFNAGKGAVFTHEGKNEMDASIMEGKTLKAGAVAGVTNLKNPIDAARLVMEKSEHVMMAGKGAEIFAEEMGAETVDPSYFFTQERWDALQRAIEGEKDETAYYNYDPKKSTISGLGKLDEKYGTVGAVALDKEGNLAAGTSTGGMTNKKYGRIGDAPIIGAGTYCNNLTAGLSSTGWGEFFIREAATHRVSDLIELKGLTLDEAARQTIAEIEEMGGDGGIIGLNKEGQYTMQFNSEGMYRGVVDEDGNITISIYKD